MIFDPAMASTAGAAFAALLAAIVLAVLGQLAMGGEPDSKEHTHAKSLSLGLPVLALLLATTYMFVLVSGLAAATPHGTLAKTHPALARTDAATALLRGSAFLFIVCGSALAVSAAGVILVIGLVVSESRTRSKYVRGALHGTLAGGVVADGIFLVSGYYDIASAFGWHPLIWTLAASAALGVPVFWSIFRDPWDWLHRNKKEISEWVRDNWNQTFAVGFAGLVILPVVFFRVWFRHGFSGSTPYGNAIGSLLFTVGCALWAGVSLAACIWTSKSKIALGTDPTRRGKRKNGETNRAKSR